MATDPDGEATDTEATETGLSQTQTFDRSAEHAAHPTENLEKGTPLGRYLILEALGKGGMGIVYAAYDPELDRKIALKLVRSTAGGGGSRESAEASSGTSRLMREAQAMAKVVHPNVVTVHEVGTWYGRVFLAMEMVDGTDLKEWLKAAPRRWQEVLDVFASAGHGLAAAHEAGLVHRDFKPENVLVGKDGRPRVTDFGLVRHTAEKTPPAGAEWSTPIDVSAVTEAGVVMGTPAFMAPEQMEGVAATPAADQFSFAVALWTALFGEKPYAGATMKELHAEIEAGRLALPPLSGKAPRYLVKVLSRALEYEPSRRYGSMRELLVALKDDPSVKVKRALRVALMALLVLAGPAAWAVNRWADAHRCEKVGLELTGVWDDARRARLVSHFDTLGDEAKNQAPYVVRWLDRFSSRWVEERRLACEAERLHQEDPRLTAARTACMARRRVRLQAVVDTLLSADHEGAEKARQSFDSMVILNGCEGAPPADRPSEQSAEVVSLQEQITRAELWAALGRRADAEREARDAVDRAKKAGLHRLASEAYGALALSLTGRGIDGPRVEARRQALLEAQASHEDEQVFEAFVALADALTFNAGNYDEALWNLDQAEATLERLAMPKERRAVLYRERADVLEQAERPQEALPFAQKALELKREAGATEEETAEELQVLANVTSDLGDVVGSEPLYERVLEAQQRAGARLDFYSHTELYLGEERVLLGEYAKAIPHLEHAFIEGGADWHAVDNAASAAWAARAYQMLGDETHAREQIERAAGERQAITRPDAVGEILIQRFKVELWQGRFDAVAATVKEYRGVVEKVADANRSPLLEARLYLAEALRRQGKRAEAYAELSPVLVGEVVMDDAVETGQVRAAAARLKLEQGIPVPDAVKVFEEAIAAIEKYEGPKTADLLAPRLGLAQALKLAGRVDDARAAARAAYTLAKNSPGDRFSVAEAAHLQASLEREPGGAAAELDAEALKNLEALGAKVPLLDELKGVPPRKLRR